MKDELTIAWLLMREGFLRQRKPMYRDVKTDRADAGKPRWLNASTTTLEVVPAGGKVSKVEKSILLCFEQ